MPRCLQVFPVVKTGRYVIPRLIQSGNMDGIWYIYVIYVYFFNRSQNKWFCWDFLRRIRIRQDEPLPLYPHLVVLASDRLPHHCITQEMQLCSGQDSATSNQICSWKRSCHCKSLYYVRGTRVALGLPWGCIVLKACGWMSVGCSCRWRPMIGTSWRSGWAADSLLTWNFCHVKRGLHWKGTKQCTASNCQGVSPLYVDLERVVPIVVGESCTTGVSWHWVQHQGASGFMQTKRWMIFKCLRCCKSCPLFLHLAFPNHISDKPLNMWYWYMFVFNRWRFPIHYSSSWRHPESSSLWNSQVLVCKDLQRNVWLRAPGLGGASLDGSGTKGTTINDVQICCVDTSSKSARDLHHTEPQWLCCIRMRRLFFCELNAFQFFFLQWFGFVAEFTSQSSTFLSSLACYETEELIEIHWIKTTSILTCWNVTAFSRRNAT